MGKLIVHDLSVIYKKRNAKFIGLDSFSYSFEHSNSYAILGASGSGKSSLLRALAGLIDYDGEIIIDETNAFDLSISERNFSFVTQNFALYPHLNVFFNIAFPLKNKDYSKEQIEQRVYDIAGKLGLSHCLLRKPKELSIGQQQRVALARALIKIPSVILLDEPLSNLDPENKSEEIRLIKQVCYEQSITMIYVTHKFSEAINVAENILVLNDGKLVYSGTRKEALKSDNKFLNELRKEE